MNPFLNSCSHPLAMISIVCLASCSGSGGNQNADVARQMFLKSVRTTESYIDSVRNATDSATLRTLMNNFNEKITAINYQFPADTDLILSEEENDSLIRMFKRLDNVRIAKENELTKISASTDSVDSVSRQAPASHIPGN